MLIVFYRMKCCLILELNIRPTEINAEARTGSPNIKEDGEFHARLGDILRPCLKTNLTNQIHR